MVMAAAMAKATRAALWCLFVGIGCTPQSDTRKAAAASAASSTWSVTVISATTRSREDSERQNPRDRLVGVTLRIEYLGPEGPVPAPAVFLQRPSGEKHPMRKEITSVDRPRRSSLGRPG